MALEEIRAHPHLQLVQNGAGLEGEDVSGQGVSEAPLLTLLQSWGVTRTGEGGEEEAGQSDHAESAAGLLLLDCQLLQSIVINN